MLGKIITSFAAIATLATAVPAAVSAHDHDGYDYQRAGDYRDNGYHNRDRRGYRDDRRAYYGRNDYRGRCRNGGSTGTIVGAIAGGLIGNGVAGRGDRTLGTVLGAGGGALAGRAINRSGSHRC